jgi:hypothetical protein
MAFTVILALLLVCTSCLFHFSVLRWLSGGMAQIAMTASLRVLVIVLVTLGAHLVEIGLYAMGYAIAVEILDLGKFNGVPVSEPLDYFYFSIVSFTSLGLGDVFPGGHLRFLSGIEALNGLLLIAWSGSFIYIAMGRLWLWQNCAVPETTNIQR